MGSKAMGALVSLRLRRVYNANLYAHNRYASTVFLAFILRFLVFFLIVTAWLESKAYYLDVLTGV